MAAGDHIELIEMLKRECDAENAAFEHHTAEADRHRSIAVQMELLIHLLESGAMPAAPKPLNLASLKATGDLLKAWANGAPSKAFGRKYERQPEFASMSTVAAIRAILKKEGPTHADVLTHRIYKFEPAQFQRVKSAVVSEAVKQVKDNKMRRAGENIFALAE